MNFYLKFASFYSRKCIWKYRLQKWPSCLGLNVLIHFSKRGPRSQYVNLWCAEFSFRKPNWGAFTLHPRSPSEHPSPSSDAIKTSELMFWVYTNQSLCPRLLPRTSVSELVATCSDFLGHGRPSSSKVVQCACSKPLIHVVPTVGYQKRPLPRVTSNPSLGYNVTTTHSGARTLTRTWILGQYKCKCALMHLYFFIIIQLWNDTRHFKSFHLAILSPLYKQKLTETRTWKTNHVHIFIWGVIIQLVSLPCCRHQETFWTFTRPEDR